MRLGKFTIAILLGSVQGTPFLAKRDAGFAQGEPISADGKGGPILGMLCVHVDETLSETMATNASRWHESPA
jgi:hypothetical protein